jgi:signal transduction histidine kinase
VILLGLPLGLVGARLVNDLAQQRMSDSAERIAVEVQRREGSGGTIDRATLADLAPADRQVSLVGAREPLIVVGSPIQGGTISGRAKLAEGGEVRVASSREAVDERVARGWALVGGLVVLSTAVAVLLAVLQARRLGEPLEELAVTAGRLGSGDTRPHPRRYGVPELDRVATVLDRSAERLGELLRYQREFAADASHQLRTPLTALSIRLEEIGLAEDQVTVRDEVAAALAQVERLTAVVDSLLARARDNRSAMSQPVDVGRLLREQAREWGPAYRRADRKLVVSAPASLMGAAAPGGLAQVVASLLENALVHGAGAVSVRAREAGEHVVVEVSDEGPGVPPDLVPRIFERSVSGASRTGLGLALARALVEADGGRLELVRPRPPVFAVFLCAAASALTPEPPPVGGEDAPAVPA